MNKKRYFYFI